MKMLHFDLFHVNYQADYFTTLRHSLFKYTLNGVHFSWKKISADAHIRVYQKFRNMRHVKISKKWQNYMRYSIFSIYVSWMMWYHLKKDVSKLAAKISNWSLLGQTTADVYCFFTSNCMHFSRPFTWRLRFYYPTIHCVDFRHHSLIARKWPTASYVPNL